MNQDWNWIPFPATHDFLPKSSSFSFSFLLFSLPHLLTFEIQQDSSSLLVKWRQTKLRKEENERRHRERKKERKGRKESMVTRKRAWRKGFGVSELHPFPRNLLLSFLFHSDFSIQRRKIDWKRKWVRERMKEKVNEKEREWKRKWVRKRERMKEKVSE